MEKRASACSIIEKLISSASEPISCEDLAAQVIQSWGRNFPANPYHPEVLVYKLASSYTKAEPLFDDLEGPIIIPVGPEGKGSLPLSPNLGADELNKVVEQIKKIKFRLKV